MYHTELQVILICHNCCYNHTVQAVQCFVQLAALSKGASRLTQPSHSQHITGICQKFHQQICFFPLWKTKMFALFSLKRLKLLQTVFSYQLLQLLCCGILWSQKCGAFGLFWFFILFWWHGWVWLAWDPTSKLNQQIQCLPFSPWSSNYCKQRPINFELFSVSNADRSRSELTKYNVQGLHVAFQYLCVLSLHWAQSTIRVRKWEKKFLIFTFTADLSLHWGQL